MIVRIVDNDTDRAGTLIECVNDDGDIVWRSWADESVDPAIRLNIDHPYASDDRTTTATTEVVYRVPTVDEAPSVMIEDPDTHRAVATYAAVVGASTVAAAAAACGVDPQALSDEALAWAAAAAAKEREG